MLILLLLAGCTAEPESPVTTAPTTQATTAVPEFTVRFVMQGHVLSEQSVARGQLPQEVEPVLPGVQFERWEDENGAPVDPFSTPVEADRKYHAAAHPVLTEHSVFLFCDEDGYLNPDLPLTADAMRQALEALAVPEAVAWFPGMPMGDVAVDGKTVTSVLSAFGITAEFSQEPTRSEFACAILEGLGRTEERVAVTGQIPPDVTADRTDAGALLEASVAHTPDDAGTLWSEAELPVLYAPGFHNIDGWLYCVDENNRFVKDAQVGLLQFGSDGRYTCGDAALDQKVADILKQIILDNPDLERLELLRKAYEYSRDSFEYLRKFPPYEYGQTGWEIGDAIEMLDGGKGNCYNYAAVFWALARGLGYDARAISGTCLSDRQPHGWVIIAFDGEDYLFDPEWEMDYRVDRHIYHYDMFMISLDNISYWSYRWTEE